MQPNPTKWSDSCAHTHKFPDVVFDSCATPIKVIVTTAKVIETCVHTNTPIKGAADMSVQSIVMSIE